MALETDLKRYYEKTAAEQLGHKELQEYYDTLLTQGAKLAQESASSYYESEAQKAASKASYDISGAYANYLKQQKAVASQAGLESGYKEEITSGLQSAYSSAYQQAKATEASALSSAATEAYDIYGDVYGASQKTAQASIKNIQETAAKKAKLYKLIEEGVVEKYGLLSDLEKPLGWQESVTESGEKVRTKTGEGIYQLNKETGKYEITDLGTHYYSDYILNNANELEAKLEEAGLLDYYYDNPELTKELFGVERITKDEKTGEYHLATYDSTSDVAKKAQYSTPGYLDEQIRKNRESEKTVGSEIFSKGELYIPVRGFGGNDTKNIVSKGADRVKEYYETLGLTDEDIIKHFGVNLNELFTNKVDTNKTYLEWVHWYETIIPEIENLAKQKYGV